MTKIGPALPLLVAEREFLIHDGSIAGAIAGSALKFVYCQCGATPKADEWYDHLDRYPGARYLDDNGPHQWWAIERPADSVNDCLLFADDPRETVFSWYDEPDVTSEGYPLAGESCDHHPSKWHEATQADMADLSVIDARIEYQRCQCGHWIHTPR